VDHVTPSTVVAFVPLDEEEREEIAARFGDPVVVVAAHGHGEIMRELETNEPVGTFVVVADLGAPEATIGELDQLAKRYRDAVLVTRSGTPPRRWTHTVVSQL
jgi:hypothetical protein